MKSNTPKKIQELEKQIIELKSENKLKKNEDRFKTLMKASEDMITIHKPNGTYLYYNGPTCYAITPEDIVGKMPNDLFDKDVSNTLINAFKKVKKTGKSETVEVLLDWLGEKKWFSEYIYPVKDDDGKIIELVKVCRNIHQRKLAEQEIENKNKALLESNKAHREVLKASSDLISVFDKKGKILFANHASKKIYGLSPKKCLGKSIFDFTHPEDREYTKAKLVEWTKSENHHFQFKNRQINTSGKILDTEWHVNVERKKTKIIKITSIIRDITEQSITHRKLIKANKEREHFFNFFNLSPDIMVISSPEGVFQSVNPATIKLLGYSEEILTSKFFLDFIHPDDKEITLKEFKKKTKEGSDSINFENRYLCKNNECIYLSWSAFFNKEDGVTYATAVDITKEKLIEIELTKSKEKKLSALLKLEKSEKRLKQTEKLAKVGSWFIDLPSQKVEWSDEAFRIWGFDSNKGTPDYDSLVKLIHTDDLDLFSSSYEKAVNLCIPYDIEFRINLSNEEQKTIRVICQPMLGEDGKVENITGSNQDITSQKIFEKAQVKHQRLKAMGEMSSSIAHDFNNSLQQMMGNLEVIKLQNDFSGSTLERLNNIGSIIDDVSDRVSALQKFGDTKNDDRDTKLIDFNALIDESLMQSRPLWKDGMQKKGLNINVITDLKDIPKIEGNNGELKSAVFNLIKNSVEAMPEGGDIIIKTGTKGKRVFATFTDTGIGMSEETKTKVFEPFFSTKGFKLGRGLGMSGVSNIIKKYNGSIDVKSSGLSKGSTFEIVFPIVQQEDNKAINKNKLKNKAKFNILWVDDDTSITEDVSELLELMGHKCTIENSGKDALEYLNKNTCDIVFTDIGMSEMNGWELIAAIRNDFGNKIKIITVSGWNIDEKAKEEHAIDFVLQKPFTIDRLEKLLMEL
ncbi:MAG: PAS domain S-box-containing protein [Polaribacter sp.]|jgi:PAS domain S-box-containing protein